MILVVVIFAIYLQEKREKIMIISISQVKQMNDELNNILMNLPEGIVLINEATGEVVLGNEEFKKLFCLPKEAETEDINKKVNSAILT